MWTILLLIWLPQNIILRMLPNSAQETLPEILSQLGWWFNIKFQTWNAAWACIARDYLSYPNNPQGLPGLLMVLLRGITCYWQSSWGDQLQGLCPKLWILSLDAYKFALSLITIFCLETQTYVICM